MSDADFLEWGHVGCGLLSQFHLRLRVECSLEYGASVRFPPAYMQVVYNKTNVYQYYTVRLYIVHLYSVDLYIVLAN